MYSWPTLAAVASSFVFFISIPIYVTTLVGNVDRLTFEEPALPSNALPLIAVIYLFVVLISISLAKGFRLPLLGLSSFFLWINCGVVVVAQMLLNGWP